MEDLRLPASPNSATWVANIRHPTHTACLLESTVGIYTTAKVAGVQRPKSANTVSDQQSQVGPGESTVGAQGVDHEPAPAGTPGRLTPKPESGLHQSLVSGSLPQVKSGSPPPSLTTKTSSIQQRSLSLPGHSRWAAMTMPSFSGQFGSPSSTTIASTSA